jgi:hypothetical protein
MEKVMPLFLYDYQYVKRFQSTSSVSLPATPVPAHQQQAVEPTRGGGRVTHYHYRAAPTDADQDFIPCKVFGCEANGAS